MSFVPGSKAPQRLKSPEQCARELLDVALERELDDFAAVLAVMCVAQESDFWCPWNAKDPSSEKYPHDSQSDDGRSVAYFQQQNGAPGEVVTGRDNWWGPMGQRMDLKKSGNEFLSRLRNDYRNAAGDPRLASEFISNVQSPRPDLRGAYAKHWDRAHQLVAAAKKGVPVVPVVPDSRPDFNEIDQIGWDSADPHGSIRSRPPINWFLHTQEANSNATDLAAWMRSTTGNNAVSYHYTVHQDPDDHGVTVVDVIDTDLYSWSCLDANVFSINGCFAGSFAGWTREQWLSKAGRAIDVMAYLAVQDCKKYPTLSANVILPPYAVKGPGISDHKYVTQALGIGNHTDVGNSFPWDVFTAAVHKYVSGDVKLPDVPNQPPPKQLTDRQLLQEVWDQARGIAGQGWPQLDNLTPVDYMAGMGKKLDELLARTKKAT